VLVSEKVDLPNCHSIIADKKLYAAKELRRPDVRREPEGASHQTV